MVQLVYVQVGANSIHRRQNAVAYDLILTKQAELSAGTEYICSELRVNHLSLQKAQQQQVKYSKP